MRKQWMWNWPKTAIERYIFSKLNICEIYWNKSIISNRNPKELYPKRICITCIKLNKINQNKQRKQIKQRNYALLASNKTKQTKQIKWTNYVLTVLNKTKQQKTKQNEQRNYVLPASNDFFSLNLTTGSLSLLLLPGHCFTTNTSSRKEFATNIPMIFRFDITYI